MRKFVCLFLLVALLATGFGAWVPTAQAADTGNPAPQTGQIVSDEPGSNTPDILDGSAFSIAQVGNTIVVGGEFTQAENHGTSTTVTRNNLLAFDATTGKLLTSFAPNPAGKVWKVLPAADGQSVYVAGEFTSAAGKSVPGHVFKVNVTTGVVDPTFVAPKVDGKIRDLEIVGNHLFIAGKFSHIGAVTQTALGTLFADTGKLDPYVNNVFAGTHNSLANAVTDALQISANPQNTELMVVGNFTSVDGQTRPQIARLDIANIPSGPSSTAHSSLSTWSTTLYTSPCAARFDTYMTDVEYSRDGTYFVVSTTGAYGGQAASNAGTSGCDVVARFEDNTVASSTPTWTAYTGSDSTWTVEVTDDVIYAGGHQRYQNNPSANNQAGPGSVSREGIAALDPVNGMPYSWDPTRTRGVGVQDILATSTGLYVGSDTDRIGHTPGNTYHPRISVLPLSGGETLPTVAPASLPVNIFRVSSGGSQLVTSTFNGSTAGTASNAPNGPGWSNSTGAFMVNGVLYKLSTDGTVARMSFDGSSYGTVSTVNAGDLLVPQASWHADIRTMTSIFYDDGELYYTKSGQNALYHRGFEVDDDVVGQQFFSTTTSGINWSTVRGAFVVGNTLYYATTTGALFSVTWNRAANAPVAGTVSQLTSAGTGWASRAMFFYRGPGAAVPPGNQPPVASGSVSCQQLVCSFNGSSSTDPEHGALSYDWNFGDGTTHATTAMATHTYAGAGSRSVTLTVTDNQGATDTDSMTASPTSQGNPTSNIVFVGANSSGGNRVTHATTLPSGLQVGDTLVAIFTANSTAPTYTGPSGWTSLESRAGDGITTMAWTKTATAADTVANAKVTVTSTSVAKSDLTVAVYRGTDSTSPIAASASKVDNTTGATHVSPAVTAPGDTGWLVTYWADKATNTTGWTAPSGQSVRQAAATTAGDGGHITALLTDSNGPVDPGPEGVLTATANSASTRGASVSILLTSS